MSYPRLDDRCLAAALEGARPPRRVDPGDRSRFPPFATIALTMREWDAEAAEWFAERYGEYATNRLCIDEVDFPPGSVVVDIGCGTGYGLRRVAARVADATLIGIDPVPRMLEIARTRTAASEHAGRIEFRSGRATAIPVQTGRADFVLAFDTFDYWSDAAAGMAEIGRVLGPHGRFIALKDAGDDNADASRKAFLEALSASSLQLLDERKLSEGSVTCTRWLCGLE